MNSKYKTDSLIQEIVEEINETGTVDKVKTKKALDKIDEELKKSKKLIRKYKNIKNDNCL